MSLWDWLVIVVVALQGVLLVSVVMVALKVKNGPVAAALRRIKSLVSHGQELASAGERVYSQNRPHVETILITLADSGRSLQKSAALYGTMTAGPREILAQWAKLQTGFGFVQQGYQMLRKPRATGRTSPSGKPGRKPSFAHRLGLVPPIVQKVERFFPYIGYATEAYRAFKNSKLV